MDPDRSMMNVMSRGTLRRFLMVLCRRNEHQQGIGRAVFLFGKDGGHRFGARCRMPDELENPDQPVPHPSRRPI
jgi:hypothetical protein